MKDVLTGRVDLVRAMAAGGADLQEAMARLLGLERLVPEPPEPIRVVDDEDVWVSPAPATELPVLETNGPLVPFWYVDSFEAHQPFVPGGKVIFPPRSDADKVEPAVFSPLASHAAVLTRLRRISAFSRTSGEPDVDRVVDQLSRGRFLEVLPRRSRKSWGPSIHCIVDRHRRLTPYWTDQDEVVRTLSRVYPREGFQVAILGEGAWEPSPRWPRRDKVYQPPAPGASVFVLGDLGCLDSNDVCARESWIQRGRRYREHGNRPVALVPCDPASVPEALTRHWTIIPWESTVASGNAALSADRAGQVAEQVLTLLSFALRVEPWLIREVRRLLPDGRRDAGIESRVWQHPAFQSRHFEAAAFRPEAVQDFRAKIGSESPDLRRQVYELIRRVRQGSYPGVWYAELLGLEGEAAAVELTGSTLERAASWFEEQWQSLQESGAGADPAGDQPAWFRRVLPQLPRSAYHGQASAALHGIWSLVESRGDRPPDGLDPARLPRTEDAERTIELRQGADGLLTRGSSGDHALQEPESDGVPPGSSLGLIRVRNPRIKVDSFMDRPAWASEWGQDRYGFWCAFRVKGVRQRLRWIPAGEFLMGSPEEEAGRYDDEGPRHRVRITRGFWLFDTPCTQALWQAVTGKNPSRFRSPNRPVERVRWNDCQTFIKRLNGLLEGIELSLPSEAQWEYACRAGSSTRYPFGDDENQLGHHAWFSGNSRDKTFVVGKKRPNSWGLYDMLGNVWEWCQDGWDAEFYKKSPRDDPMAPAEGSADRVFRGGSWYVFARAVRAASRQGLDPGYQDNDLGFRCAEVQNSGPVGVGSRVERGESRSERRAEHVAEQSSDRETPNETRWLTPGDRDAGSLDFPNLTTVRLSSDLEALTIRTMTRPDWASAIGRDAFGLWAEFTIEDTVRQRLRWIPPGRFMMGSPPEEAGRWDDEGPQRTVWIPNGFWLFDTPCTQALWEAVMGKNPSRFLSPTRPVEQVSWEDCRAFVKRLNGLLKGLELSLPSEAQWEYACRAGTTGATYAGDLEVDDTKNGLLLDRIAWYRENCRVDYELAEGEDISSGSESKKGGTHPVAGKAPNAWGLYDMLGNVFEWCMDLYRKYGDGSKAAAPASAYQVFRGSSWGDSARIVRAAHRGGNDPGYRNGGIGFRCAEFQAGYLNVAGACNRWA